MEGTIPSIVHPPHHDQHYPPQKDSADAVDNLVECTVSAGEQGLQC